MIWAILALVGVPLWLCALGIFAVVTRNRSLRQRPGSVPVRLRKERDGRWRPGHAIWVHDVLAFRGSPAAWAESLVQVGAVSHVHAERDRLEGIHRLGDDVVVATFALVPDGSLQLAARAEHRDLLLGPFNSASGST